ncbi:MAG: PilZ domain-containing protein [Lachnospiraceae bacterium]|nr:PilZ domain-containing protein [Lachnospiraceae bacterium]
MLDNINIAKNLQIQILWDDQKIEFLTEYIGTRDNEVLLKPYIHNGHPLDLNVDGRGDAICHIFGDDPETGIRKAWRNIALRTIDLDGQKYYSVATVLYYSKPVTSDRRNNVRMRVHTMGELIEQDRDNVGVMFNDVSNHGVSFYAPASYSSTSNFIHISFEDVVNDESYYVTADAKVAYTKKKPGMTYYGCEIPEPGRDFLLYVFMKKLYNNRPKQESSPESQEHENTSDS